MKINRNYRFVLTNITRSAEGIAIDENAITGERMFSSECHYYAEKNILECLKDAAKRDDLGGYLEYIYCIYKENKPEKVTVEREEDGKTITETREIPGTAMLIETIFVDENGTIYIQ